MDRDGIPQAGRPPRKDHRLRAVSEQVSPKVSSHRRDRRTRVALCSPIDHARIAASNKGRFLSHPCNEAKRRRHNYNRAFGRGLFATIRSVRVTSFSATIEPLTRAVRHKS